MWRDLNPFRRWKETPHSRYANELEQVKAIRDDLQGRLHADPGLVGWCNGAIFTLSWILGERGSISPAEGAHRIRTHYVGGHRAPTAPPPLSSQPPEA